MEKISLGNLKKLKEKIKQTFPSSDVLIKDYKVASKTPCMLVFVESLVNKELIGTAVLKPLASHQGKADIDSLDSVFLNPEKRVVSSFKEAVDGILQGDTMLFIEGQEQAFSFSIKYLEKRPVSEPPTSTVIKGPREGFVESIETNVSLIRRRIKSPSLIFEKINVGRLSDTTVVVCYIDGVCQDGLKDKVLDKLKQIDIDAVLDSSYISQFLIEHPTSLFKQIGTTEKPDIFVSKILEGRVGIIVDGSPIALSLPYILLEDLQSAEDYYTVSYKATLGRIVRVFSIFLSILLPSFFVAAQLFHLQLIPLPFLLTIVGSIKGIPLSPSYEMFFTLLIFEVLNEASVRMPKYVGMVVSIVGGLVLGETAINAGIISAPALMIVALSGICLYTVPELEKPFSVLRLLFLLIAGSIGGYGLLVAIGTLIVYFTAFENYGAPILSPYAPLNRKDMKDGLVKENLLNSKTRPEVFRSPNKKRLKYKEQDK